MRVPGQYTARLGLSGLAVLALVACGQSASIPSSGGDGPGASPSPEPSLQIADTAAAPADSDPTDLTPGLEAELARLFGPADAEPLDLQPGDSAEAVVQRAQQAQP